MGLNWCLFSGFLGFEREVGVEFLLLPRSLARRRRSPPSSSQTHLVNLALDQRAVLEASLGRLPRRSLLGEELADKASDPPRPAKEEEARGLFCFHFLEERE